MCAVDPDLCAVEDGAEAQEHPVASPALRQLKDAAIKPDPGASAQVLELRLPRPGNVDGACFR
jgi:hypothetical protein